MVRRRNNAPPRPNQILRLNLARRHLSVLGRLLDVRNQPFFLLLKLDAFAVEFALGFFEGALVLGEVLVGVDCIWGG